MRRKLLQSKAFIRAARRTIKKNPSLRDDIQVALELLSEDAFNPQLKTHKMNYPAASGRGIKERTFFIISQQAAGN